MACISLVKIMQWFGYQHEEAGLSMICIYHVNNVMIISFHPLSPLVFHRHEIFWTKVCFLFNVREV